MTQSRRERLRAASELQRRMADQHGDDLPLAMARALTNSSSTQAERTYREAMARNHSQRFSVNDVILPDKVLQPDETVLDVAVGGLSRDTFPLLLVSDRRIILTIDQPWRRWRIVREVPLNDVVGAELQPWFLLSQLRVHLRKDKDISLKLGSETRPRQVAALINRLVDAPTPGRQG